MQIFQIIIEVIISLLGFYLIFFKSYFQEKGKNLATQEDIEEITKKIEGVKSEIGILTQQRISLSTEKKNCLLEFNEKYSAWLNYIIYVDTNGNQPSIDLYYLKVEEKYNQLNDDYITANSKLLVYFFDDNELLDITKEIGLKTYDLSFHLRISLMQAKNEARNIKLISDLPDAIPENLNKGEQLKKYFKQQMETQTEYSKKRLELFKPVVQLNFTMLKLLHNRIHDFSSK